MNRKDVYQEKVVSVLPNSDYAELNYQKIHKMVKTIVASSDLEGLDEREVKKLKAICLKYGDAKFYKKLGAIIFQFLNVSSFRFSYGTLLLIDYLFMRPHHFRVYICKHLYKLFSATLGNDKFAAFDLSVDLELFNVGGPFLTEPNMMSVKERQVIKARQLSCFKDWYKKFAPGYPELEVAYDFLRTEYNIGPKPVFVNGVPQRSEDDNSLLHTNVKNADEYLNTMESLIEDLLRNFERCIERLIPKFEIEDEPKPNSPDDFVYRPMPGLSINILLKKRVRIKVNASNRKQLTRLRSLIDNLNGPWHNLLQKQRRYYDHIMRDDPSLDLSEGCRKVEMLDLKLMTAASKANEIEIIWRNEDSDDDDDFVEVPDKEEIVMQQLDKEHEQAERIKEQQQAGPSNASSSSEAKKDVPTCRARLASGRLCPRADKLKCPFHGPLVERDDEGRPIDSHLRRVELRREKYQEDHAWRDPKYQKELRKRLGITRESLSSLHGRKRRCPTMDEMVQEAKKFQLAGRTVSLVSDESD